MSRITALSLAGLLLCFLAGLMGAEEKPAGKQSSPVDFNREIRPILANHCYACHGPDEKQRKAGLRLDLKDEAFKQLKSGELALVPGKLDESELWRRISAADEKERMPPAKFAKPLAKPQVELVRRWIEQGAKWQEHWAYTPPQRPPLPAVKNISWPKNGIDHFILARLEKEGLKPAPEADRTTLIRRLSFDLTGLPPTPAEIDDFLADTSANAYEKVVDRLLASPHYGERMAIHWLDLARYADTNGYHIDNHRDMWKWREWVIDAFNQNMPFDQFTIEQFAGDMLPNATLPQKIASGFNRNTMVTFEGGADPNEYLTKYIIDRVTTTATVWLGTSLACAECHDHKYDPFTQKEFYQLYAFFHNVPEKGLDGGQQNPAPSLKVPTPEQEKELAGLRQKIKELDGQIKSELAQLQLEEPAWEPPDDPEEYVWVDDELPAGAVPTGTEGAKSWKWVATPFAPAHSGRHSTVRTAVGTGQQNFEKAREPLRVGKGDKLFAHVYLDPENPPQAIMLQFHADNWEHRAYWGAGKINQGVDKTPSRHPMGELPKAGEWVRLEVPVEAVGLKPGTLVDGLAFTQHDGTVYWDKAGVVSELPQGALVSESQAAWEAWEKVNRASKVPTPLLKLIKADPEKRTQKQQAELRDHYRRNVSALARKALGTRFVEHDKTKKSETDLDKSITQTMVMQEMDKPRDTFVLVRGDFQTKGEKVTAAIPRVLPPLPEGVKPDRLGLAKWLVMPNQPLTARVTVNRWWEQIFGTGIIKTSEDFGSQGEWPKHPELLDWLAVEFVSPSTQGAGKAKQWDIKAFMKVLVMSAAYRQSSRVTPEVLQKDQENRLLARGPRFRLYAECIRDNALAASGLLDRRLGGPSVRPYQPSGLWEAVSIGGNFSSQSYKQDKGKDLYRRGMYTYWKRSLPHPTLIAFDAPNREVCTDRRPRTNTPLQALVLMNDPIYVECARALGQRIMTEGGADTDARLTFAFKLCTARTPRPEEMDILKRVYERQLARFQKDPKAAERLVSVGESPRPPGLDVSELAAWTAIGNLLLNLDETITKG